jgi:hypothetical protein
MANQVDVVVATTPCVRPAHGTRTNANRHTYCVVPSKAVYVCGFEGVEGRQPWIAEAYRASHVALTIFEEFQGYTHALIGSWAICFSLRPLHSANTKRNTKGGPDVKQ